MIQFQKIPPDVKQIGAIAIGRYAIFCKGFLKATTIVDKLVKADNKKGIPIVGFIQIKKEKIFYCRFGFINDNDIYEKS